MEIFNFKNILQCTTSNVGNLIVICKMNWFVPQCSFAFAKETTFLQQPILVLATNFWKRLKCNYTNNSNDLGPNCSNIDESFFKISQLIWSLWFVTQAYEYSIFVLSFAYDPCCKKIKEDGRTFGIFPICNNWYKTVLKKETLWHGR